MKLMMLIFDFDNTIVDADSDEWIAEQFGAAPLFNALLRQGTPWNDAVNAMLGALHAQGVTIEHIQGALCRLPLRPDTVHALKAAHRLGCELRILSDANTFFINAILKHHGLSHLFSHIHTNPFWVDDKGCFRVGSFHAAASIANSASFNQELPHALPNLTEAAVLPHNCPLCPPNLCKGRVIDAIRGAIHGGEYAGMQIIYVGDGVGDLCPSLRLTSQDCVLPRRGYRLAELLSLKYVGMVKARVRTWESLATGMQEGLHALEISARYGCDAHETCEEEGEALALSCAAFALPNLEPAVLLKLI